MREITSPAAESGAAKRARAPKVKIGEIWRLGRHRLVCGDATDPAAVKAAIGKSNPLLMVTDPPYGVGYDPSWRAAVIDYASGRNKSIRADKPIANDDCADWHEAWRLFPGDIAYVWHSSLHASQVELSLVGAGFRIRSQIIWDKGRLVISRGHYHWRHEPCWYAVRRYRTARWNGDRKQSTVWQIPHRRSETGHAAEKPIECMKRPIENNSKPGDAIYDPFLGSGTSLIAAEMTNRICHAIEIEPAHVAIAIARWEQLTGRTAVRG